MVREKQASDFHARARHYMSGILDTLEGRGWRVYISYTPSKKPGVKGKWEAWGDRAPRPSGDNPRRKQFFAESMTEILDKPKGTDKAHFFLFFF